MRVLMAVDGSEHSRRAKVLLQRACGGRAHRVTVLNVTPPVTRGADGVESITEALKRSGRALAEAVAGELKAAGLAAAAAVEESADPADAILDRAEEDGAGLVVLGARGLTPFKTFLLGSVSQKVSRHFAGSVLIARAVPGKGPLRVLAGVDGSYGSRRALAFLGELGLPKDARVTLLHVVETMPSTLAWGVDPGLVAGGYEALQRSYDRDLKARRKAGARILADAAGRLKGFKPRAQVKLAEGHAVQKVLEAAEAMDADLVVLGRRGLSKTERFLMGSVSHKVSAHAPCAVLIVK